MDGDRFDGFVKSLAAGTTRRRVLRGLGGGLAGLIGLAGAEEASAAGPCKSPNVKCGKGKNATCCQAPANGTATCVNDACGVACSAGLCPSGGQCVANTSISGCGPTCAVCQARANATAYCDAGTCRDFCTPPGFIDCGGVCVDFNNDPANCGVCGNVCASINGVGACVNGGCVLTCDPGFMSCDGNPATGCETNVASNPAHCGFCFQSCDAGQSCSNGACTRLGCDATSDCGQCPGSSNGNCRCGATMAGNRLCHFLQNGCAGHFCDGDADCTADYGPDSTCIFGFCSTPALYCTSDAECGPGLVCVNKNGGCGGCDNYTGGTKGICNPICVG